MKRTKPGPPRAGTYGGTKGCILHARIVAALQSAPMTTLEVMALFNASRGCWVNYSAILKGLHQMGILHVSDWRRVGRHGMRSKVYAVGEKADAAYPDPKQKTPPQRKPIKPGLLAFGAAYLAMRSDPRSVAELQELSGLWITQLYPMVRFLRSRGVIYLHAWDGSTRLWKLGNRSDAARPKSRRKEVQRAFRARQAAARPFEAINDHLYRQQA